MGLIDKLREAEEQGRGAAHRELDKTRRAWDDAERRMRRKMRLHPRPASENAPESTLANPQPPVSSTASVAEETLPNRTSEEDAA